MPKKWCPKCQEVKGVVNRVFEVWAAWNEEEDDYVPVEDSEGTGLHDTCVECGSELEEIKL